MQDFKLVSDSCCDLTPELASFFNGEMVPFSMLLENINYTDDDSLALRRRRSPRRCASPVSSLGQ